MRSLNPDRLRALTEVVAQGSFTRAAKRLNLAQPTVSLQIRELEMRLDFIGCNAPNRGVMAAGVSSTLCARPAASTPTASITSALPGMRNP